MISVVIIDDELDIRVVLRMALETVGGMEVVEFENGTDALAYLEETQPSIILLDYMMPEMDGPATLQKIQELPGCAAVPVVFLTARAQTHELAEYQAMGVAGTITKPFDPMQLPDQIKEYL
jgi:CheY-like chemotaxis protein